MLLKDIVNLLEARVLVGEELLDQVEVDCCFSADLMSDVLGRNHARGILITGITNPQAVRTADIADIRGVCVVRGKMPETGAVTLAKQKDIPLFMTKFTMFEACGILYTKGLKAVEERR